MNLNIFILIGPPGGGKGCLSRLCSENLGWLQLSTGNLCREHIAKQTEIGKKIDFILKSGKLISDDLVTDMVEQWLLSNKDSNKVIIFDGYPRTIAQAEALQNLLKEKFKSVELNIVKLSADEEVIIKRLSSRIVCSNSKCQAVYSNNPEFSPIPKVKDYCDKCKSILIQRSDDKKEAVKERLIIYSNNEKELLNYYNKINQDILELNAQQPIEKVFAEFRSLTNGL